MDIINRITWLNNRFLPTKDQDGPNKKPLMMHTVHQIIVEIIVIGKKALGLILKSPAITVT